MVEITVYKHEALSPHTQQLVEEETIKAVKEKLGSLIDEINKEGCYLRVHVIHSYQFNIECKDMPEELEQRVISALGTRI